MEIRRVEAGQEVTFHLEGRMTFKDNGLFQQVTAEVAKARGRTVVVDLSRLDYIDSFGIGLFLVALEDAKRAGATLQFRNPHGAVRRVFELTDLEAVLTEQHELPRAEHHARGGLTVSPLRELGGGVAQVAMAGRFTFADHEPFDRLMGNIAAGRYRRVEIDLAALEFMDSAGLSMLMIARDELARQQGELRLLSPSGRVFQLLRLAAVDTVMGVEA